MRKWALLLSVLIPATAASAVEVTPQVGYRAGGLNLATGIACLQSPCPSFAESGDDPLVGVIVGVPLRERLQFEVLLNRQSSSLAFSDFLGAPPGAFAPADLDVTHLHAGLLRSWQLSSVEPFVVLGAGQTWLEAAPVPTLGFFGEGFDVRRLSASLGAGARIGLGRGERWAVRFEARGYWVDLPDALMDRDVLMRRGDLTQVETTTGLTFKI